MLQEDLALNKYFKGKLMKYNRFREKKLKMKDIFEAYCDISLNLWDLDSVVYCYGDFGESDILGDPIFIYSDGIEEDYTDHYLRFLEIALDKDYVELYLEFESCDRCYKAVLSLLKSCGCLKVTQEEDNTLYVKLPSRPSYEELEDVKDTFDEIYDVLKKYNK